MAAHGDRIIRRLERNVFPSIGDRPIADLSAPDLLAVIRKIETRGALETAHRTLGTCGQVFGYAVATGRAERDLSGDLRGALPPTKSEHFAAVTDPKHIGELLRAIDGYGGTLMVQCALRLAPLVFVRPGELRRAEWTDIDLDAAEWRYTVTNRSAACRPAIPASAHHSARVAAAYWARPICFSKWTQPEASDER